MDEVTAKKTVRIHNHLPIAVALHVDVMHDDEHGSYAINVTGVMTARRGPYVELKPGENDGIDAEWWQAWSEQNKGSIMATNFTVEEQKDR